MYMCLVGVTNMLALLFSAFRARAVFFCLYVSVARTLNAYALLCVSKHPSTLQRGGLSRA